jgi:hypothetical protein
MDFLRTIGAKQKHAESNQKRAKRSMADTLRPGRRHASAVHSSVGVPAPGKPPPIETTFRLGCSDAVVVAAARR